MNSHLNPNLFVVTGGPGAGKTTVLEELTKVGFRYAPEAAREIIREQVANGGTALPWSDREAYIELMLRRSIKSFDAHTPAAEPMFADRGIPDTLGYARLIGLRDTHEIEGACSQYRYGPVVFAAPPWEEIYCIDTERKQHFAEAKRTYEIVCGVYHDYGYQLVELPRTSAPERARFILSRLSVHDPAMASV